MTTKDLIIQEIEQLSEPLLEKVLEAVRSLKDAEQIDREEQIWQAYLASERQREEVYRRLANS